MGIPLVIPLNSRTDLLRPFRSGKLIPQEELLVEKRYPRPISIIFDGRPQDMDLFVGVGEEERFPSGVSVEKATVGVTHKAIIKGNNKNIFIKIPMLDF